jgi:hypothetical protein
MIAVDVLVANVWMACLLFAAGRTRQIDKRVGADTSAIDEVKTTVEEFSRSDSRGKSPIVLVFYRGYW